MKHNHVTRDIKPYGQCSKCDEHYILGFQEWLEKNRLSLARVQPVTDFWGNEIERDELVPVDTDEAEVILERYLRNVRMIYGEPKAKEQNNE